ncbi:Exo-alpha-sialidase [Kribbella flavida DSM 17836]|uniref:exo-alpha-sialidase n=1 Tax=Kribbella flavida (strain DSM 17836 / JCM 10339 / NBRC 14399) TaxID=479435 RepID=D2PRS6_KRIFD|nr:sialidase family protein [Kribbella flavida]ADB29256.1 Exo-alpha-sialidase [Kribbella flavida DSM 17836]
MQLTRTLLTLALTLSVAGTVTAGASGPPDSAKGKCVESVPFRSGTDGYASYRIPAVVKAADGALLAFAEGRRGGSSDTGDIDIVLRRSGDGGCTWSPQQVVTDQGPNTIGNPAPVVDPASGDLVLLSVRNGPVTETQILRGEASAEDTRRVFVQRSTDDGRTFSAPTEITAATKLPNWRWYATTPGHAIALRSGRLLVPANHSIAPPAGSADTGAEAKYYGGHSLYSDDGGRSWQIGYVDDNPNGYLNVNETTAAQLPDGRVYFNTREHNGTAPGTRADAYSADGGETLVKPFRPQATLIGPVVQASVLSVGSTLVYSGPADPAARAAMTLRTSTDQGVTWQPALAVSGLPAAYSDLVSVDRSTLGLLYETGDFSANETITFRRIPLKDVVR